MYFLEVSFWLFYVPYALAIGIVSRIRRKELSDVFMMLVIGVYVVFAMIMNIVANKLSGLNYISLATDSCMSHLFGALIGEGIVVILQRLIRKEQSE